MSIVTTGLLRYLYNDAKTDVEHQSSKFWQCYLQSEFRDLPTYAVICKEPSDESRRQLDIVVERFDQSDKIMTALLCVECEPGGSIAEVEKQALDAAKGYIEEENSLSIYTMTTVGVAFRLWFCAAEKEELTPFHGESTSGDWSQYINADSEHACVLPQCIELIKRSSP